MSDRRSIKDLPVSTTGSGAMLGALVVLGGATWYLRRQNTPQKRHQGPERRHLPTTSDNGSSSSWLLGALGAGLAGAALGAAGLTRHKHADSRQQDGDVHLASHITIERPPEEVYRYWKNFRNLPEVMSFVERVEPLEGNISHWVARVPAGPTIEWDAEIVDDRPGRRLAWRSLEGSDLQTWGTVVFERREKNGNTDLSIAFNFSPPDNASGTILQYLAKLENAALDKNLRSLKSRLEANGKARPEPPTLGPRPMGS